jgi:DNA-binding NarL/FixJ family response regulator
MISMLERISPKEREALEYYAVSGSCEKVAEQMYLSQRTVECHMKSIRKKLDLEFTSQAVVLLLESGFKRQLKPIDTVYLLPSRLKVLELLRVTGDSNSQMAEELDLATKTVEAYIYDILSEAGLSNRIEVITYSFLHPDRFRCID